MLVFERVSKSFQSGRGLNPFQILAVNQASLQIAQGESLGLVGESGSGKTTMGRLAVGLLKPSAGRIELQGRDLGSYPRSDLAGLIQMVFQDPYSSLNPRQRIGSSVAEPLRLQLARQGHRPRPSAIREQVAAMLTSVGLDPALVRHFPHELSGGQRQRVAIARALISGAGLLVCDEPVSALDASVQAQILNMLKTQLREKGLTYLFISHDLGVVGFLCKRIAVMYCGIIVEQALTDDLLDKPAHPYTRALIDSVPVRDPKLRGRAAVLPGDVPDPARLPAGCVFHPRCPQAQSICAVEQPPLHAFGSQRSCLCHFPLTH